MHKLEVEGITVHYGNTLAVDGATFSVDSGDILGILGPSGCGKTTTIRAIAGLASPSSGVIRISGRTVFSESAVVPTEKRGIGMVFQSYALWPHMTVDKNIAYGLRKQRCSHGEVEQRVAEVLKLVSLSGYGTRFPSELSGGQQQRVALARSLVVRPDVLLLDEPLSNLDARLREQMRDDLRELICPLGIATVFITHDRAEAMAVSDRIIVMDEGRIQQSGIPRDVYANPRSRFVADLLGPATYFHGTVLSVGSGSAVLETTNGVELTFVAAQSLIAGCEGNLMVRPETVAIALGERNVGNCLKGVVRRQSYLGSFTQYQIEVDGSLVRVHSDVHVEDGEAVSLVIAPADLTFIGDPGS